MAELCERALGSVPQHYGQNITILGALSCTGLESVMTFAGVTDSDVFRTDVYEILCPTLCVGDIGERGSAGTTKEIAPQLLSPQGDRATKRHLSRSTSTRGRRRRHTSVWCWNAEVPATTIRLLPEGMQNTAAARHLAGPGGHIPNPRDSMVYQAERRDASRCWRRA